MVCMTILTIRQDGSQRRLVVEIMQAGQDGTATFSIMAGGKPLEAKVLTTSNHEIGQFSTASGRIQQVNSLQNVSFQGNVPDIRALKVWAHQVTVEAESIPLPVLLTITPLNGKALPAIKLDSNTDPILTPILGINCLSI